MRPARASVSTKKKWDAPAPSHKKRRAQLAPLCGGCAEAAARHGTGVAAVVSDHFRPGAALVNGRVATMAAGVQAQPTHTHTQIDAQRKESPRRSEK